MNNATTVFAPCALVLTIAALAGCGGKSGGGATSPEGQGSRQAVATLEAKSGSTVTGTATFTAEGDKVSFRLDVSGAPPGEHAVHIHDMGDCSAHDAMSAGGHWNPKNEAHGKWGQHPFHLGDIGNMSVDNEGRGSISLTTDLWTLGTGAMDDVTGHAVMVHAGADDFATQPDGAAGARIGCGVVCQR